jgi:hypothetical protein
MIVEVSKSVAILTTAITIKLLRSKVCGAFLPKSFILTFIQNLSVIVDVQKLETVL